MYGIFGSCTSLFHLAVQFPKIAMVVALAGFVQLANAHTPGNMMGTDSVLQDAQAQIEKANPTLQTEIVKLRADFDRVYKTPTEEQVRYVLSFTDSCTDKTVKEVLSNPDKRREAAWLLYLDTYAREGPSRANTLFVKNMSIPPPLIE